MSMPPSSSGDHRYGPEGPAWPQHGAPAPQPRGDDGWWNLFESAAVPPPPPPRKKRRRTLLIAASVAAVATLAVMAAVVVTMNRSSSPSESAETVAAVADPRLLEKLPLGVREDSCRPQGEDEVQSSIVCDGSGNPGEPLRITLREAQDKAGLNAMFSEVLQDHRVVVCPGNIQSPGPWRRNAAPQVTAGTLMCGYQGENTIVAWTDEAPLVVVVAEGGPGADALTQLYRWWSEHS